VPPRNAFQASLPPWTGLLVARAASTWRCTLRSSAGLERVRALPGFMDDLVPYPENALPGRSRSIYD
jgi:hypothetical protein